jgi:hypothetical protein
MNGLATLVLGPQRKTIVRVVYSDESGVGSERDEPLTVVAGLMLNIDSQWHPVLASVEKTLREILGREEISTYEIRARNLYHQIRRDEPTAKALMSALMKIPDQHRVPIFYGAVDRAGYMYFMREIYVRSVYRGLNAEERLSDVRPAPDAFGEALKLCLNRVDSFVHTVFPTEQVLWIHDRGRYDDDAKSQLEKVRVLGASEFGVMLRENLEGYLERSHVVDTIYFGDSRDSRALQLADACCSTITRHLRGDPVATPYYEMLKPQITNDGARPEYENSETIFKNALERERTKKARD